MKTHVTQLMKHCMLGVFLLMTGWVSAATYTAVSSGVWTSTSTWAGGLVPGPTMGALDNVVIDQGITVTLDTDIEFSGLLSGLEVNGTLQSSANYLLDMNSGVLSGTGTIDLNQLRFGALGSMTFSGNSSIDNLWNNSLALDLAAQLDVNDTLFLDGGSLNLNTGSSMTWMTGAVVRISDGTMSIANGLLNSSNDYSVVYVGTDKNTGLELAGSGLTDVWVKLDDNSQVLSVTGDVTIEGVVHHNHGRIDLNDGSLTLMNDYMAMGGANFIGSATSDLTIQHSASLTSNLVFDASGDELNNLTISISGNNGNANLASSLSVNGTLMLDDGDLTLASGMLTMETGSEIVVGDGHVMVTGGSFGGTNAYNVTYQSTSSTESGIELTGSGLNDLSIHLQNASDSVEIMNTFTVDGELEFEHGGMAMNGYDLTLEGSLSTSSDGWFGGDPASDLTFNTLSLAGDTVWFHAVNHTFGTVTINADDASDLWVGNDLRVENITMSSGGIRIWNNEVWLNSTGTISGADEDRYVVIDGSGSLVMHVQVSAPYTMYPVGTDEGYSPAGLQQNSGVAGYFKVNAMNGVWSEGTSGTDMALVATVVNRTWDIQSVNGGAVDLNLRAVWSGDIEENSFDRTDAYIMHYTAGNWDALDQTGSAAVTVGTMYQLDRENITSLSPFAVAQGTVIGLDENAELAAKIYPNPVQDILNCVVAFDETTTAEVVDVTGNVLHAENVNGNHTLDFSAYPKGVYFVNYTNSKGTGSYKVIKSL